MSKAHEEGGDWTSSEHLASAFLTLGIAGAAEAVTMNATRGDTRADRKEKEEKRVAFLRAGELSVYIPRSPPAYSSKS